MQKTVTDKEMIISKGKNYDRNQAKKAEKLRLTKIIYVKQFHPVVQRRVWMPLRVDRTAEEIALYDAKKAEEIIKAKEAQKAEEVGNEQD